MLVIPTGSSGLININELEETLCKAMKFDLKSEKC